MTREATCYAPMADGQLMAITAVANPAQGSHHSLAAIKLVDGQQALQRRLREVVEVARLTEFDDTTQWKLTFYIEPMPAGDDRAWELAAIVADRMARGVLDNSARRVLALGCSDAWEEGRVQPLPGTAHSLYLNRLARQLKPGDVVFVAQEDDALAALETQSLLSRDADVTLLSHLGGLAGQPDPAAAVRRARAWFPLVGSNEQQHQLAWVEVTVLPAGATTADAAAIQVLGQDNKGRREQMITVLEQARSVDPVHVDKWQTLVRFQRWDFTDNSFELALVMADRIARGREVPAPGRVLASGCSSRWARGRVENVAGMEPKCALLRDSLMPGDRILLPPAWEGQAVETLRMAAQQAGASLARIERINW